MREQTTLFGALAITATLAFCPMTSAVAEEVLVPVGTQADRTQASFPGSGMSQASVRTSWGAPMEIQGPVGQPPITQWHYRGFIVYFEGNRVIHTVLTPNR